MPGPMLAKVIGRSVPSGVGGWDLSSSIVLDFLVLRTKASGSSASISLVLQDGQGGGMWAGKPAMSKKVCEGGLV